MAKVQDRPAFSTLDTWKNPRMYGRNPVWGEDWSKKGADPLAAAPAFAPTENDAATAALAPKKHETLAESATRAPSFKDVIDAVNPLQQLPVVGTVYRAATGDTISPIARFVGGAILGGPIGAAIAMASVAFEGETGAEPFANALSSNAKSPEPQTAEDRRFTLMLAQLSA